MIIDKVVRIYLDPDDLELVMKALNKPAFDTEAWCSDEDFPFYSPLKKFVTPDILKMLRRNTIDYVVFKLDC